MRFHRGIRSVGDPSDRLRAVRALPDTPASIPPLLQAVGDPSPEIAKAALTKLSGLAGSREVTYLRERMLAADPSVVRQWAATLREIGDMALSVDTATRGLRSDATGTRLAAAVALGELGGPCAASALLVALRDPIAGVRRCGLLALAAISPQAEFGQHCRMMLFDSDDGVRTAAVDALVALAVDADRCLRPALDDPSLRVRRRLGDYAALLRPATVDRLLADSHADVRAATAWSLAHHPRPDLTDGLVDRLSDAAWEVRRAACRAIGVTGDEAAIRALLPKLGDPDATVRAAALNVLAELPGHDFCHLIAGALPSTEPLLRRALVYALVRCPEDTSIPILALSAADPDAEVRLAVVHVAGTLAEPRRAVMLGRLAADADPAVRYAATAQTQCHLAPL